MLGLPTFYNNRIFNKKNSTINNLLRRVVTSLAASTGRAGEWPDSGWCCCILFAGSALWSHWVSLKNKILVNFIFNLPQTKFSFPSVYNWWVITCLYLTILHAIELFLYLIFIKRNAYCFPVLGKLAENAEVAPHRSKMLDFVSQARLG